MTHLQQNCWEKKKRHKPPISGMKQYRHRPWRHQRNNHNMPGMTTHINLTTWIKWTISSKNKLPQHIKYEMHYFSSSVTGKKKNWIHNYKHLQKRNLQPDIVALENPPKLKRININSIQCLPENRREGNTFQFIHKANMTPIPKLVKDSTRRKNTDQYPS